MEGEIGQFRAKAGFLPGYFSTIIGSAVILQNFGVYLNYLGGRVI